MNQIVLLVLTVLIASVTCDFTVSTGEQVRGFDDDCGTELNVPKERVEKFKKQEFEEDRESFCHVHCVAKKMNVFDDEHGVLKENLVMQLVSNNKDKSEADIKKTVDECAEQGDAKKDDKCLWAFTGFVCLGEAELKASPDMD